MTRPLRQNRDLDLLRREYDALDRLKHGPMPGDETPASTEPTPSPVPAYHCTICTHDDSDKCECRTLNPCDCSCHQQ